MNERRRFQAQAQAQRPARRRFPWRWALAVAAIVAGTGAAVWAVPAWRATAQRQLCSLTDAVECPVAEEPEWVVVRDPARERIAAVDSQIRILLRSQIRDSLDSAMAVNVWKRAVQRSPVDSIERAHRDRELKLLRAQRDSLYEAWRPGEGPARPAAGDTGAP